MGASTVPPLARKSGRARSRTWIPLRELVRSGLWTRSVGYLGIEPSSTRLQRVTFTRTVNIPRLIILLHWHSQRDLNSRLRIESPEILAARRWEHSSLVTAACSASRRGRKESNLLCLWEPPIAPFQKRDAMPDDLSASLVGWWAPCPSPSFVTFFVCDRDVAGLSGVEPDSLWEPPGGPFQVRDAMPVLSVDSGLGAVPVNPMIFLRFQVRRCLCGDPESRTRMLVGTAGWTLPSPRCDAWLALRLTA